MCILLSRLERVKSKLRSSSLIRSEMFSVKFAMEPMMEELDESTVVKAAVVAFSALRMMVSRDNAAALKS